MQAIVRSLTQGLGTFFAFLPQLVGAVVILIVGYVIARILQAVVGRVLKGVGFDGWMDRAGVKRFFDRAQTNQTPVTILGKLVFWFVFVIAIVMATDALGISQVSAVLTQLIAYIPNVIAAVLILVLAALLAQFVAGLVRGATGADILGTVTQAAIIVYAAFAALTQLGIAVQLTAPTFLIVLGAVALAAAIAFGWGARNVAQDIVERAYDRSGARERMGRQEDNGADDNEARTGSTPDPTAGRERRPGARRLDR